MAGSCQQRGGAPGPRAGRWGRGKGKNKGFRDAGAGSRLWAAGLSPARTSLRLFFFSPNTQTTSKLPRGHGPPSPAPRLSPTRGAALGPGLCNQPVAIYLAVATFEDHSKGSVSYQVLLAVLKVPHHLHHPSARGMKPPGRTKGKQRGFFLLATAASRQPAAGWEPAPVLAAPGGGGSSSHTAADPRAGGAAAGRHRGEGLRRAWGGEKRGISGAGCEGKALHRRRDEGPSQRGRGLRARSLLGPMAPPQRGLPAPRPRSGTEPQSIQRREGRRGPRLSGGGCHCRYRRRSPRERERRGSNKGADGGVSQAASSSGGSCRSTSSSTETRTRPAPAASARPSAPPRGSYRPQCAGPAARVLPLAAKECLTPGNPAVPPPRRLRAGPLPRALPGLTLVPARLRVAGRIVPSERTVTLCPPLPSSRSRGREAKLSPPHPAVTSALSSGAAGSEDNAEGPPGEEGAPE